MTGILPYPLLPQAGNYLCALNFAGAFLGNFRTLSSRRLSHINNGNSEAQSRESTILLITTKIDCCFMSNPFEPALKKTNLLDQITESMADTEQQQKLTQSQGMFAIDHWALMSCH